MTPGALRIEMTFRPEWDRIEHVRQAIALALRAVSHDDELGDSVSMASAELLENAVKYGTTHGRPVEFRLQHCDDWSEVRVTNAIDLHSSHAAVLAARIGWIVSFDDPADAYTAALGALFERADADSDESGLGLTRIAYEGRGVLECDVAAAGRVTVRARFAIPPFDATTDPSVFAARDSWPSKPA